MFLGTQKDNVIDMTQKGRHADTRGEKHAKVKLTEQQVIDIRSRYKTEKIFQRELASEYHVSREAISSILSNHNWKHI